MADDDGGARKTLLAQARAMKMPVDGRWSTETLAEKVAEQQQADTEAEGAAIRAQADTCVYLLRDAFPVADEKHLAGETIMVPADMAKAWYRAGAARPGEEADLA